MKKQLILMFSFLMLFALTIETATAQTPSTTTRTETVKKDGWWKRTFGKKKKKQAAVQEANEAAQAAKEAPVTSKDRSKVAKPRKDVRVERPSKPSATKKDIPQVGHKPSNTNTVPKKDTRKTGGVKPEKPAKSTSVKPQNADRKVGSKPKNPNAGSKKDTPKTGGVKPEKTSKITKPTSVKPHPSSQGAPACGVEGCEHPGKHYGLHKKQNPVRPYKWTKTGYMEVDESGVVVPRAKKEVKEKKVKKIKSMN